MVRLIHRTAFQTVFFLVLLTVVFAIYRYGIFDLPRIDHLFFLKEQEFEKSNLDFFLRIISYNRSAHIAHGDYFLYRPGFFGYLAFVTIFFRENLLIAGVLSLIWHAITSFVLFLLIKRISGTRLALFLSLVFCVQYAGMEMLIWRHISPYMIGLIFFSIGLMMIMKEQENNHRAQGWNSLLFLFLATLFHESFPSTMMVLGLISFLVRKRDLAIRFLIPGAVWLLLNWLDFLHYHPESILGTDAASPFLTLQNSAFNIIFLSGLFIAVFLCPFLVRIEYENFFTERGSWDPTSIPPVWVFGIGMLVLGGIILFLIKKIRFQKSRAVKRFDLETLFAIYFLVLIVGFGVGRLTARTTEYLRISTYYYYLSNFCLILLMSAIVKHTYEKRGFLKKSILVLMAIFGTFWMVTNYYKIQKTLSERYPSDKLVAKSVVRFKQVFKSAPEYCYGGSFDMSFNGAFLNQILFSQNCTQKPKTPLYLMPNQNNNYNYPMVLAELRMPESENVKPVLLDISSMENDSRIISLIDFGVERSGFEQSVLSRQSYNPIEFSVDIKKLTAGGIVLAYQNPQNFVALYSYRGQILIVMNRFGIGWSRWYRNKLVSSNDYVRVSVRRIKGGKIAFFCDNKIIELFQQGDSLTGNIGFFTSEDISLNELFKNVSLKERSNSDSALFSFEPVMQVSLSE